MQSPYEVKVGKDPSTGLLVLTPWALEIDQDLADGDSKIIWTFDESLPNARFSRKPLSLTWEQDPPWWIIKRGFEMSQDGRAMWIFDRHVASGSTNLAGWKYLMKVVEPTATGGSKSFTTGFSSPNRPITSPVIINR